MSERPVSGLARLRHDLRTPVNHILGYAELLAEELADHGLPANKDLSRIAQAARSILELINSRLDGTEGDTTGSCQVLEPESADAGALPRTGRPRITGRILIVDDDPDNRDVLSRHLTRQGHSTRQAADGAEALQILEDGPFELVLLDVMMPGQDGFSVLQEIKSRPTLRHLPVIMISALDDLSGVIRCIETGAEDFLAKPFNPTLLRARIGACLEKMKLRDAEQTHLRLIEETQARLSADLAEAAKYVRSILPAPASEPFPIDWSYLPSTELGGDAFGYHWIDGEHFAIYLLDVCGHGVGASLLSVSAIHVIRSEAVTGTDFRDPSAVLSGLNAMFRMERQNNMYFTIWYGVYHLPTRTLRHASGGHPPALLMVPGMSEPEEFRAPGPIIGVLSKTVFESATAKIPPAATLVVLSDGAYEIRQSDGRMTDFEEFKAFIAARAADPAFFQKWLDRIREQRQEGPLDDDFSLLRVQFP